MPRLFLLFGVVALFTAGCGRYQLFALSRNGKLSSQDLSWRREQPLRPPQNELERSVVAVAANHKAQGNGETVIVYVSHENEDTLVAVIDDLKKDGSRYEPKQVRRYVVQTGLIKAIMAPQSEPFPDVRLERAVLVAADRAIRERGWAVVPLKNWVEPVTLKGTVQGECRVEVKVFQTTLGGPGNLLCSKWVNTCPP